MEDKKNSRAEITFSPVETKRASQAVFEQIESLILSGKIKKSERLPSERELMRIYHRSQPTIREALCLLESSGYIKVVPGGASVVSYSTQEVMTQSISDLLEFKRVSREDIVQFISSTEPEFLRPSLDKVAQEDLIALEEILEAMEAADSLPFYIGYMMQFHIRLIQSIRNPLAFVFWEAIGAYAEKSAQVLFPAALSKEDAAQVLLHHKNLLQAVHARSQASVDAQLHHIWSYLQRA